jgi:hypothetical protein
VRLQPDFSVGVIVGTMSKSAAVEKSPSLEAHRGSNHQGNRERKAPTQKYKMPMVVDCVSSSPVRFEALGLALSIQWCGKEYAFR